MLLVLAAGPLNIGRAEPRRPLNVVLIGVDTLRYDHLGYRGHPVPVSPNFDQLAAESVVFTNAFSQSGWTLPSVATILTGRYPKSHSATDFHLPLRPTLPTLASILKEHDYHTQAYVSQIFLKPRYGFAKGFDHFDTSVLNAGPPHEISTAKLLTDLALDGLKTAPEPFFLWLHYFDPHFKYRRHMKWRHFGDAPIERYDQEIAYTDDQIGRILEHLRETGLMGRTIVVFTADHGEEFGEHGGKHHHTAYDEVIRVPLTIKAPGLAARQSERTAEQIDLLPTLLRLLELPGPKGLPGRDLLGNAVEARPVFIERDRPPRIQDTGDHRRRAQADAHRRGGHRNAAAIQSLHLHSRRERPPGHLSL